MGGKPVVTGYRRTLPFSFHRWSAEYHGNCSSCGDGSIKDSSSDGPSGNQNNQQQRRRRNGYNQGRRMSERARRAQKEESIRRTLYVSDIDHHVTEEHLAELFCYCGKVCTGAKTKSEEQSLLASRKYVRIIHKLGFDEFKVQNIVVTCDVQFLIRLEGLACSHNHFCSVITTTNLVINGAPFSVTK
ncbi:uncharacterized protein LOC120281941 [Dioscorea cayenensis subsp. rotundata]|uniref:Uncharacterized protein LOC120281941 n=1 Tax=Dioscorea cayennensis subsp. rotundata TaxID=55577 RepID=A0AB40D1K8_DIOCR|nr:uncharacterized protein LOC120281941 [Dioscorea cayenensis subsp. rotundata]